MNIELKDEQKIHVTDVKLLYGVMHEILMRENHYERGHEHVWTVCLSPEYKILNIELISLGAITETTIKPMQVYRVAIQKGAVKIALVHNHCFEGLDPSGGDEDVTDRLIQVGRIIGVDFFDHMIINEDGYYSFLETGLLDELAESTKWIPRYEEKERILKEKKKIRKEALKEGFNKGLEKGIRKGRKEGEQIGIEKGLKRGLKNGELNKAKDMARVMKENGEPINKIVKFTGLSPTTIRKL